MSLWLKKLLLSLSLMFFQQWRRDLVSRSKAKGISFYLKVLQTARRSLIALALLFLSLQVMLLGLVMAVASGLYLLPWTLELKAYLALGLGLSLFLFPLGFVIYGLSDRFWYRQSGAEDMVEKFIEENR